MLYKVINMEEFLSKEGKSFITLESDAQPTAGEEVKFLPKVIYMLNYVPKNSNLGEKINLLDVDVNKFEKDVLEKAQSSIRVYDQIENVC